ncbi:MAG: RidA family protein [Alphaproteobacteria bacterium]|nr:RidA family protein [Alphaproteobacteria bacterium]
MTGIIESKLAQMGVDLPEAPAPAANYVPYVVSGDLVFVSGQVAKDENGLILGKLGDSMTIAEGQAAARACALNLLAQVKSACDGDLDRLDKVVKLGGFVNATQEFENHPEVINGASDFLGELLGEAGAHARAAVGCSSLPLGVAVEIEGIFRIK